MRTIGLVFDKNKTSKNDKKDDKNKTSKNDKKDENVELGDDNA